ncbi:ATP-binding protein [Desulfoscipio geothermicus]|uniref:Anti-sigma regulatory factor (Ser/Thr protein kinase) n=1 Tax=Desulfoscipio geothermicus DSM 3669 TaxID=1121426 RepID=A0A1I6CNX6_9FIRM|nr:ATP-binding protein [Desulfoscipio geothermicus]SFQ94881.1 Anti-sigma regulatory factor (Ser/Thr protein kinase) [Desulfoscipio geothermicus DSM 3669]
MRRCLECAKKEPGRPCVDCKYFIQQGPLRRVLSPPVRVLLEDEHGKQYPAHILVFNTTGFGLETEAPVPGRYVIRLQESLWVEVAGVPFRGKNNVRLFDIICVHRRQGTASRLNSDEYQLLAGSAGELVQEITRHLPEHLQDLVREKLLAEVEKSELINALRVGKVMKYEGGRFRYLSGQADLDLPMEEAEKLMRQATRQAEHRREVIISADGQKVFDLHGVPFDYRSGGLLAFDITEVIEKERRMHRQEMQAYRDAIAAVTGGRLYLANGKEMEKVVSEGAELAKGEVRQTHDLPEARRAIREALPALDSRKRHAIALCLSEALTNTLKHAGGGCWQARQSGDAVRIIVRDRGPGIKTSELARATLMQHYSTKNSMGCGFTLMLYYADYLYLNTAPSGTALALDFGIGPADRLKQYQ